MLTLFRQALKPNVSAMVLPGAIAGCGLIIICIGMFFPRFYNASWEAPFLDQSYHDRLMNTVRDPVPENRDQTKFDAIASEWFTAREKALSPHDQLCDVGTALIGIGLAVATLLWMQGIKDVASIGELATPRNKTRFYVAILLAWLMFVPAEWCYYMYTDARGEYPWFGDIIYIPCVGATGFGIVCTPIVLAGAFVCLGRGHLPALIFSRPLSTGSWFVNFLIAACLLVCGVLIIFGIYQQPQIVVPSVFATYLILSARAGRAAMQPDAMIVIESVASLQ